MKPVGCLRRRRPDVLAQLAHERAGIPTPMEKASASRPSGDLGLGERTVGPFLRRLDAEDALALVAFPPGDGRRVVAVILEDGSVRTTDAPSSNGAWSSGSVSGRDWILWWDRRDFRPTRR